ncbi:MAG: protein translocase subunit SecF [Christensenellales bacterium]|jgi:preprotein translocase subunit SecF|nr:protein translocase subunit SecF [Clostridiales bacterium]
MKKLMDFLRNKIAALKIFENRRIFFLVPLVVVLVMLICGTVYQLSPNYDKFANIGVDFQGGTLLNVKMESKDPNVEVDMNTVNRDYNVEIIRRVLANHGFEIATSQASGNSALVIRYSYVAYGNDPTRPAIDYGTDEMTAEMKKVNDKIMEEIETAFKTDEKYKDYEIEIESTASLIGTSSSMKLLRTALISVSIALAVMFLYIIIRFDIFTAASSIIALLHDVIIMMAFTVIFRVEIGSTIVAAIITIVGYSINNSIVVFDRLREIIKPYKQGNKKYDIPDIVNTAITSSFTRQVYTTLTTLITIAILAILGVASIRTFAFPIIFGLIAGFYSSAFIAAPLWGLFNKFKDDHKRKKANKEYLASKITPKKRENKNRKNFAEA